MSFIVWPLFCLFFKAVSGPSQSFSGLPFKTQINLFLNRKFARDRVTNQKYYIYFMKNMFKFEKFSAFVSVFRMEATDEATTDLANKTRVADPDPDPHGSPLI